MGIVKLFYRHLLSTVWQFGKQFLENYMASQAIGLDQDFTSYSPNKYVRHEVASMPANMLNETTKKCAKKFRHYSTSRGGNLFDIIFRNWCSINLNLPANVSIRLRLRFLSRCFTITKKSRLGPDFFTMLTAFHFVSWEYFCIKIWQT